MLFMKIGQRSLLFGVHQFIWHPIAVTLAWHKLFGWPNWREIVCIVIHDWGYWGCSDIDENKGMFHPEFGAYLAERMFGPEYRDLVLYHSRWYARQAGREPSRLCWADKLCLLYEPYWFYITRAWLSGELEEDRNKSAREEFMDRSVPNRVWFERVRRHLIAQGVSQKDYAQINGNGEVVYHDQGLYMGF